MVIYSFKRSYKHLDSVDVVIIVKNVLKLDTFVIYYGMGGSPKNRGFKTTSVIGPAGGFEMAKIGFW